MGVFGSLGRYMSFLELDWDNYKIDFDEWQKISGLNILQLASIVTLKCIE